MNWKTNLVAPALTLGFAFSTLPAAFAAPTVEETAITAGVTSSILDARRDSDPVAASFARLLTVRPAKGAEPTIRASAVDPLRSVMDKLLVGAEPWYHVPTQAALRRPDGAAPAPLILNWQGDSDQFAMSFTRVLTAAPATSYPATIEYSGVDPLRGATDALLAEAERWYHVPPPVTIA